MYAFIVSMLIIHICNGLHEVIVYEYVFVRL